MHLDAAWRLKRRRGPMSLSVGQGRLDGRLGVDRGRIEDRHRAVFLPDQTHDVSAAIEALAEAQISTSDHHGALHTFPTRPATERVAKDLMAIAYGVPIEVQ